MRQYTLVVAGAPELHRRLSTLPSFGKVLSADSTGGLRDLIAAGELGSSAASKDTTVFMFADDTPCDTPEMNLSRIVQWLTTKGWRVMILAATPNAREMARANPAAGLVEGPFTVNSFLAAMAASGVEVGPVPDGFETFDIKSVTTESPGQSGHGLKSDAWGSDPGGSDAGGSDTGGSDTGGSDSGWLTIPQASEQQPGDSPQDGKAGGASASPVAMSAGWGQVAAAPSSDTPGLAAAWGQGSQVAPQATQQDRSGWGAAVPQPGQGPAPSSAPATFGQMPALGLPPQQQGSAPLAARVGSYQAEHQPSVRRRGHVIVVTAPKGGTGKSSLSLNLTSYLGLRMRPAGRTVCIVDTNFQQADTGKHLNVYSPNITHILKDPSTLTRERIMSQMVHKPELGFSALLGPAMGRDANPQWINARLYNQILPLLKEHFDYIVVDTPVAELFHDIHSDFALPNADFVLVPITPNLPTLMNADRWLHEVCQPVHVSGGAGLDRNKVGIVLNRAKETIGLSFEEVQTELAQWRIVGVIPDTDEWQRANNENALVATRNYQELNDAFSQVLHAATGENLLLEGVTAVASPPQSFLARLFSRGKA